MIVLFFVFKQKTAYDMRISDWSSDVCSSDLQPISSADRRYSIVFNGEIYNQPELRRELEGAGYAFTTYSDTETLLASFAHWGDDAWLRLQGMYAADRKSVVSGRSVSVRVDLGGRGIV